MAWSTWYESNKTFGIPAPLEGVSVYTDLTGSGHSLFKASASVCVFTHYACYTKLDKWYLYLFIFVRKCSNKLYFYLSTKIVSFTLRHF